MHRPVLAHGAMIAVFLLIGSGTTAAQEQPADSERACEVLGSGVLTDVFQVSEDGWSFRPASRFVPQALCTANARSADGSSSFEVALTILKDRFDSPEAAVASLESAVETLSAGRTVEVGGRTRTIQVDFEPFIDRVGDQAAWAPRLNELSVAHRGTRFAVTVTGMGGPEGNRAKAIETATRIGEVLSGDGGL
ncbi:MAG: hypothetical protein PVI57_15600 [Gemmatimonadota bacterium]|jgi:hypothetical protein